MAEQAISLEPLANGEPDELPGGFVAEREDEEQLLQGLRTGTESAYETLILQFEQPIFNLVSRLLKDQNEACDVVQEVFLKVFRKIKAFRGQSSLKTWVYRIAVNEAHNHSRWHGRHRRPEVGLDGPEESRSYVDTIPAQGESPFDYVLDRENQALLEEALAGLNPSFRTVVVLRDIEDLSYEEIAAVLQVPMGTVKSRILRGREALREELERRLESGPAFHLAPQTVE